MPDTYTEGCEGEDDEKSIWHTKTLTTKKDSLATTRKKTRKARNITYDPCTPLRPPRVVKGSSHCRLDDEPDLENRKRKVLVPFCHNVAFPCWEQ